jgi:two-component system, LytTR family, response regulator
MKLRTIIVDDESLARKMLEDYVHQFPFFELVGTCKNAFEALAILQREPIDLMFLDIQMPGLLGTQFLESLRERPMVIFVTAYSNYAVESYELDVIDYLMKPVSLERFTKAALKAFDTKHKNLSLHTTAASEKPEHFFVNVEYALVKISVSDITHIEGMKDYVKIHLQSALKPVLTKSTMKGIEEKLPADQFMRVHKSFIVHVNKVASIRNHLLTIGKHEVPVSESALPELMARMGAQ